MRDKHRSSYNDQIIVLGLSDLFEIVEFQTFRLGLLLKNDAVFVSFWRHEVIRGG